MGDDSQKVDSPLSFCVLISSSLTYVRFRFSFLAVYSLWGVLCIYGPHFLLLASPTFVFLCISHSDSRATNVLIRSKPFQKLVEWAFDVCDSDQTGEVGKPELYAGLLLVHLNLAKYAGPAACYVRGKRGNETMHVSLSGIYILLTFLHFFRGSE